MSLSITTAKPPAWSPMWSAWLAVPERKRAWLYTGWFLVVTILHRIGWILRYRRMTAIQRVVYLPGGLVAKATTGRERDATILVSQNTNLPVPQVFDSVTIPARILSYFCRGNIEDEEYVLLIMSWLPGRPLTDHLKEFDEKQVKTLSHQLAATFHTLRQMKPPTMGVCRVGGRECTSFGLCWETFGPFSSISDFNDWMLTRARNKFKPKGGVVLLPNRPEHVRTVFSHGDLRPHNILVDKHGNLTGVINWECAGYMPEQWDGAYSLAMGDNGEPWATIVYETFESVKEEIAVEYDWRVTWE